MRDRDFIWFRRMPLKGRRQFLCPNSRGDPEGISADAEVPAIADLENIWNVAHMSVNDVCKEAGLTQGQLAARFRIPKRIVEDWCRGVGKCFDYTRLMIVECLGAMECVTSIFIRKNTSFLCENKIAESMIFFQKAGFAGIDEKLLVLLISTQFDSYRRIVAECTDRKAAEQYMDSLMIYHFGGWTAFFESVGKSRGGL